MCAFLRYRVPTGKGRSGSTPAVSRPHGVPFAPPALESRPGLRLASDGSSTSTYSFEIIDPDGDDVALHPAVGLAVLWRLRLRR
jgi:hypothetical protein